MPTRLILNGFLSLGVALVQYNKEYERDLHRPRNALRFMLADR